MAYAAFHDTKYDDAILSDVKLQTALDELDVLKSSVDTAYKVLLDAALSRCHLESSRLRRCKENLDTRIAELMNLLSSNAVCTRHEQRSQCVTSETIESKSVVRVAATECNDDRDSIQIDDAGVQSYNIPGLATGFYCWYYPPVKASPDNTPKSGFYYFSSILLN